MQQLRDPDGWGINEPHFGGTDGSYGWDGGWGAEMEAHEPPLLAPLRPPWMPQEEGEDGMVSDGREAQGGGVEGTHAADGVGDSPCTSSPHSSWPPQSTRGRLFADRRRPTSDALRTGSTPQTGASPGALSMHCRLRLRSPAAGNMDRTQRKD